MPEDDRPTINVTLEMEFAYTVYDDLVYAIDCCKLSDVKDVLTQLKDIIKESLGPENFS